MSRARGLRAAATLLVGLAAAMAAGAGSSPVSPGGGGARQKAVVKRSASVEALIATGRLEVVEEYPGSTLLVRGAPADLAASEAAARPLRRRRIEDKVILRSREIDTTRAAPLAIATPARGRLEILQFHGPMKERWLRDLRARGGTVPIAYLPYNAYLVWVEDDTAPLASGAPVQWRGELRKSDRLSSDLESASTPKDVTVQVARAGSHDAAMDLIRSRALAVLMPPHDVGGLTNLRVTLPPDSLAEVASIPEVVWIEPFEPATTHDERSALIAAGQVAGGAVLGPGYLSWLEAHGLDDLDGTVVDITDTGLDSGDPATAHVGLRGRISYTDDLTGVGRYDDCAGHGTNIAGIIAGGPLPPYRDSDGYLLGLGVAPGAFIGSTRIFDCAGRFLPGSSFTEVVSSAYSRGARIGNNSWGGLGPHYNTIAAEYDALVRDADGDVSNGEQSFLPVFSAGNFGPNPLSIGWPATAKNVLSVGATENLRTSGTDGCGTSNSSADNVDQVVQFSSRGPTGDGRIKPDLVAPGTHIQSLASTSGNYTGVGVCNAYFPPGQHLMNWSSGTSQAAAHVTGAAAIAAVTYRRLFGAAPGPAMIKAMLINHAHDLGSTLQVPTNTTNRPNTAQGWGRVDVAPVVELRARFAEDQRHVLTATGQTIEYGPLVVEDPNRPVLVTLAWTDAPGLPIGWSFVNDLDLVVQTETATYQGNVIDRGVSVPGGQADQRNNVEMVILPPGATSLTVTVEAANLAGDGVPSVVGETDQDFAIYVANVRVATNAGAIDFTRPEAICGSPAGLRLADRALSGFGRTTAAVESGLDRETVFLTEAPEGSGVFAGAIDVTAGAAHPGDGLLQTSESQSVSASYDRLVGASGTPEKRSAAIIARCAPPVLTEARVDGVGDGEATLTWTTDRPADSEVTYGVGLTRKTIARDPKLVTQHRMRLRGLTGCAFHTATVSSTDAAGLRGTGPATPLQFSTGSGIKGRRAMFRDDMESLGTRWTHSPVSPSGADDWELGQPAVGPPGAFSGRRVWGTNLDGSFSAGADAALVSPPIDLRDAIGPQLTFMHHYSILGGSSPDSFNDGAWVEISADGGASWTVIDPAGGYPDTIDDDNPYLSSVTRVYAGFSLGWVRATFDLAPYSGSVVQVRFRLWHDAGENRQRLPGWYFDDVLVTAESSCHQARVTLDGEDYGCSSSIGVDLSDSDLDINAFQPDVAQVTAASAGGSIAVTLRETGPSTGTFRGTVDLSPVPAAGRLAVAEGESVSILYEDTDSGGGIPATATASAVVSDCTPPPAPAGVTAIAGAAGALTVSWLPPDPATASDIQGYRIYYDTDGSGPEYRGTTALQGPSPVRVESAPDSATLTALSACAAHFVAVTSFDRFGNESAFAPELVAFPTGSLPCAAGRVYAAPQLPGCRQTISLTVNDANADADTQAQGQVEVHAESPSHPGGLTLALAETGPATGVFLGALRLSPSSQPGSLTVAGGETVTIRYLDADDGRGIAATRSATVRIGDCAGPNISDIRVSSRSGDRATVHWSTDEPSTSVVQFGADPSLGFTVSTPDPVTEHAVTITGLTPCTMVFYTLSSADSSGNASTSGGAPRRFGTYRETPIFFDNLESGAVGWTHTGLSGSIDEWELGPPVPPSSGGPPGGPPAAFSGLRVWGTDLDGTYENEADLVLVSPPIDLGDPGGATVTFKHWYDLFSSGPPTGFDDGAFVEVSTDDGATWSYITPVGGYPDAAPPSPYLATGAGIYAGQSGGWRTASFVMDAFAGHIVRLRFHLYEDPAEISQTSHAGWYIDDVMVTRAVACHDASLELDREQYACNATSAVIRLEDLDADTHQLIADTAVARLASEVEPGGETALLVETGPSTGRFSGSVPIASVDAPGTLAVREGDTLLATYDDADDGSGAGRLVTASAKVPDCTPPTISGVRLAEVTTDSFRVEWSTVEAGDSRVLYGPTLALGSQTTVAGSRTEHSVTVTGLDACTSYHFTVASLDAAGNLSREDSSTGARRVTTHDITRALAEDFETGAPGWTHLGSGDSWAFAPGSSSRVATTTVGGSYVRPADEPDSNFVLLSPWIDMTGLAHPMLTFSHSFDFSPGLAEADGGWVEAWEGRRWITLTPDGGYPGFLNPEGGTPSTFVTAYTGRSAGKVSARFDLAALTSRLAANAPGQAPLTRLRFHVFVKSGKGPTAAGWAIDDVRVTGDIDCRAGLPVLERSSPTCAAGSVPIRLHDRDLDTDVNARETATITVESSGGPAPLTVTLLETEASSGLFRGEVPLSAGGEPGTARAAPGDRLTLSYEDADDGSGSGATAVTEAIVRACAAPVISGASLEPAGEGLLALWATDRPADSRMTLQSQSGPALVASDPALVTSHRLFVPGIAPCTSYSAAISSTDPDGLTGTLAGPGATLTSESVRRTVIFADGMEGPDPGWTMAGQVVEWQRGTPLSGPKAAFSGQGVYATDLNGPYDAATNAILFSPPIDLTRAGTARLTFWHWYDVFADTPPNSADDGVWVEAQLLGGPPIYLEPLGGYPDSVDADNGQPLIEGSGVYAGRSGVWKKAVFDLTPLTGNVIKLRFRIWNDAVELLVNGRTGDGWYIDDLEVSSPAFCFAAPTLTPVSLGSVRQGGGPISASVSGTGFRPGATLSLGPGTTVSGTQVISPEQMTFDFSVEPGAVVGPRALTVANLDGQTARIADAMSVVFDPTRADIDRSGRVDDGDLALLAATFAAVEGEPRFLAAADLNVDGLVDGADLARLAAEFGKEVP